MLVLNIFKLMNLYLLKMIAQHTKMLRVLLITILQKKD